MNEWKWAPLGELAETQLGKMLDQKKNAGEYHRYLGNDNVQWNSFKLDEVKEMRFKSSELERFRLRRSDLLVCEGGDPGRCALWESDEEIYYQKRYTASALGKSWTHAICSITSSISAIRRRFASITPVEPPSSTCLPPP